MAKCQRCNGQGFSVIAKWKCPVCDGSGYVDMTNEEYLRSLNTEQLAEFLIASIKKCKSCASGIGADEVADCPFGECGCHFKGEVIKWLKQPHHD